MKKKFSIKAGSPQFRLSESLSEEAASYYFYTGEMLDQDLCGIGVVADEKTAKKIRTNKEVVTVRENDLVYSLVTKKAALVSKEHEGYLLTQNYVILNPYDSIDPFYFVFLLNEDLSIKKQIIQMISGSMTLKVTIKTLENIVLPKLPDLKRQRAIGTLYFAIKKRKALVIQNEIRKEKYLIEALRRKDTTDETFNG